MPTGSVPAAASTSAIPFGQAPTASAGGSMMGFAVAFVLLAVAFMVLWFIRRRGIGGVMLPMSATTAGLGWNVVQRVRLTPTSQAIVLREGEQCLVVVESRFGIQVSRIDAKVEAP
jgi:hypothetical protein